MFHVLLTFSLLLPAVLLRHAARTAELHGVMDQGFLNLFVVYGMTEKDPAGLLYNANVFLGPGGVIGKHSTLGTTA